MGRNAFEGIIIREWKPPQILIMTFIDVSKFPTQFKFKNLKQQLCLIVKTITLK
jgi:hypothetical protein